MRTRKTRGFNHNFRYRGREFHIQSEASRGRGTHACTQVFFGGTVLLSRRKTVEDGTSDRELESALRDQHKQLLRDLCHGQFDDRLAGLSDRATSLSLDEVTPPRPPAPAPATRHAAAEPIRHAIRRKNLLLRVRTVDLGPARCEIITEVLHGPSPVAARRSEYERSQSADEVVEQMREQHRATLQKLRVGGFDARLPLLEDNPALAPA